MKCRITVMDKLLKCWRRACLIASLCVTMAPSVLGNDALSLCGDETGFNCMYKSNTEEMTNVPIVFEKALPSWLTGTLVRNGPGLFERKDQSVTHVFDGLAKLTSWKFFPNGSSVFSTRFVTSDIYKESKDSTRFPPYLFFSPPDPPFDLWQKPLCILNGLDNMNINIMDFPGEAGQTDYAVVSDHWKIYQVSIDDLSTVKAMNTKLEGQSWFHLNMMSSGHPLPEPGTSNRITFVERVAKNVLLKNRLSLVRMSSISGRQVIAEWKERGNFPYMHAFSVTTTKGILMAAPFTPNLPCIMFQAAALPCMDWNPDQQTTLYIADLKTGAKTTIRMEPIFALHHINAYNLYEDEIVMDVISYDTPDDVLNLLKMDVIKDENKRRDTYSPIRNKRILINLKEKTAEVTDFSSSNPVPDGIEMPTINENYRGKKYCFVYGIINFANGENFEASGIVKKNMCKGGKVEATIYTPYHYLVEPVFVPRPNGDTEDDGVLLTPILRGKDAVSYLAVIDAKTMEIVNKADLPTLLPISFHGRFFPDSL